MPESESRRLQLAYLCGSAQTGAASIGRGQEQRQIKTYLSSRYSDFILYRPQVKQNTWALWLAPIVLLLVGLLILVRIFQRQKSTSGIKVSPATEQRRLGQDQHACASC